MSNHKRWISRRAFLGSAALSSTALSLVSTTGCGKRRQADRELRIFVYAGGHDKMMREVFVPAFEQQTEVKVSLFAGWWDGVPKLKAAPEDDPPFDLMITDATQGYPAAREGLFASIDLANIPNHRNLAPSTLDNWIFRERHGLPYPDSVMTLAYNKKRLREPPKTWSDLFHADLSGKLGLYSSFYMSLYTFACVLADTATRQAKDVHDGRVGDKPSAYELLRKDLHAVIRFARDNRERVKLWWPTSTDMILSLINGSCVAGNMHSPEYLQALKEKPELGALVPEANRAFVQVFWAIPAGSPSKDLAERAINLLFSEEVQFGFAQRGSATAILSVAERMANEDSFWKQLYPHTAHQFRSLRYYPYELYADHWDELADEWDRTVLRK